MSEQFTAFITGFNELIPSDHVNVFDERELELLLGGIAEIDVDDWKKHTDYRGYTETDDVIVKFWQVRVPLKLTLTRRNLPLLMCTSAFAHGMPSKSRGCFSLLLEHREYLSMASKICRAAMDHVVLPLKKLAR